MRYDTSVSFWDDSNVRYNPRTHKQSSPEMVGKCLCNVTDLGVQNQVQLLGSIKQGSKTIRMVQAPPLKWSYVTIDGSQTKYRFISDETVLKGYSIIVGEDANG